MQQFSSGICSIYLEEPADFIFWIGDERNRLFGCIGRFVPTTRRHIPEDRMRHITVCQQRRDVIEFRFFYWFSKHSLIWKPRYFAISRCIIIARSSPTFTSGWHFVLRHVVIRAVKRPVPRNAYVVNPANSVTQTNLTPDVYGWGVHKMLFKIRPASSVNTPAVAGVILSLRPMCCI